MNNLIILATGNTISLCPYDSEEVWGVNGAYTARENIPQAKGIFKMHKVFLTDHLYSVEGRLNFDVGIMNELGYDIITLHKLRGLHAKMFPYKRIVKKFKSEFFTSTICYMLAYTLDQQTRVTNKGKLVLKEPLLLRLYGVDMLTTREYLLQKGGVEYWLGYAQGLGCDVFVAKGSAILQPPTGVPYGKQPNIDLRFVDPYNVLKGGDIEKTDTDRE